MGDSNNPKDRMRHHRKQKNMHTNAKYKKGPPIKPISKPPKLESNWDRYNQDDESTEPEVSSSGRDFAQLANMPITHGTHFQFKKDKVVENIPDHVNLDLFNLDLKLLSMSLSTIPLYQLIGLNTENLTQEQRKLMEVTASKETDVYSKYLQGLNHDCILTNLKDNVDSDCKSCSSDEEQKEEKKEMVQDMKQNVETRAENDLEKWLDDVLDD